MAVSFQPPRAAHYDVVIVGGAMMGASTAWFLTDNPDFKGSILVVEQDPSYEFASTSHSNSCIRLQFSSELNVRVSQFAADFINHLPERLGNDPRVPSIRIQNFGYLYLADNAQAAQVLRENQRVQVGAGAATRLLTADQIAHDYPFYRLDDIVLGSINTLDEGYWDSMTVFDWWRRIARERGVEFLSNRVVAMSLSPVGDRVSGVTLATGETLSCDQVVNASGPRASLTARMAGIDDLPVEPRKRYTYVFTAQQPLDRELPLTIDPSGVHCRQDGRTTYMAGGHSVIDPAVDHDDFTMDLSLWEEKIWPAIAHRIPQFEAIKVMREWAGHYAYNVFDHNAILGPHTRVRNFLFLNGFSGHGLQQSPAMGRGTAEWLTYGEYRTLDLSPFHYDRIVANRPFVERSII